MTRADGLRWRGSKYVPRSCISVLPLPLNRFRLVAAVLRNGRRIDVDQLLGSEQ